MKKLPLILLALTLFPCSAQAEPVPAPQQVQTTLTTEQALSDVRTVYAQLSPLEDRAYHPTAEQIRRIAQQIRPACDRLRRLPPDRLTQVCLLADAIMWQSDWMEGELTGGGCDDESAQVGLELLCCVATNIRRQLARSSTPEATAQALLELVDTLGGMKALDLPGKLYDCRMARDYATVYEFLHGFCTAATAADDATCIALLVEQKHALDYLMQQDGIEQLRVKHLTAAFRRILISNIGTHEFSLPVLPEALRSEARMQALEPFFTTLPALRELIL